MLNGPDYRPRVETFEVAGGRFHLVDPEALLTETGAALEPVLHPTTGPAPLLELAVLIAGEVRGGVPVVKFQGRITLTPAVPEGRVHPAVVGIAYVVPVLDALQRLIGEPATSTADPKPDPPASPSIESRLRDEESDLTAILVPGRPRLDGRVTHLITTEVENAGPEQLRAFVRVVVGAARPATGDPDYLTGRAYTLSRSGETVRLDHLGGLDDIVRQLREVADSFRHPEVMARWGARRPQGVLMSGPPGTGKTTLARALATEIGGTLKEIRTPDILDKWVGASERNIKKIFTEARRYRTPTVLLFDELFLSQDIADT